MITQEMVERFLQIEAKLDKLIKDIRELQDKQTEIHHYVHNVSQAYIGPQFQYIPPIPISVPPAMPTFPYTTCYDAKNPRCVGFSDS